LIISISKIVGKLNLLGLNIKKIKQKKYE